MSRRAATGLEGAAWTVVHDFGYVLAGAERVTRALANDVLDGAPVVALGGLDAVMEQMELKGGWRFLLPRWLMSERGYRAFAPFYPFMLRRLPVIEGNVVCSSYAFSHHVRCTGTKVVYCHTPLRQVWSGREAYLEHAGRVRRLLLRAASRYLRARDASAAGSAQVYMASSGAVAQRIRSSYGRSDAVVVAPPLDTAVFRPAADPVDRDYFLWVGRIVEPYKRLEMTIDAFRGTPHRLLVAGEGRDRARLEALAPDNVVFLGWQGDTDLARLYQGARAVIFPSEDDFGLVPVESMACGTPSVAFAAGGARETVVDGVTGVFFDQQVPDSLRAAVERAAAFEWDHDAIAQAGKGYGLSRFTVQVQELLRETTCPVAGPSDQESEGAGGRDRQRT